MAVRLTHRILLVLALALLLSQTLPGVSASEWCYQESATSSTACGGLATGAYSDDGSWSSIANTKDGSWSTEGHAGSAASYSYAYVNYTKPAAALSTSYWQEKGGTGSTANNSIPANCWAQSQLQFRYRSYYKLFSPTTYRHYFDCWDGGTWQIISGSDTASPGNEDIYEEGMWWYINHAPEITSLVMNSSAGGNTSAENLTAYVATSDDDGENISLAYDWRLDSSSIAVLNTNFDVENSGGSGKTRDYSSYGNNCTEKGDATWGATSGFNATGGYTFDGSNDYLDCANDASLNTGELTVMFWVKTDSSSSPNYRRLMSKGYWNGSKNLNSWTVEYDDASHIYLSIEVGGTGYSAIPTKPVQNDTWTHVAATYNGSQIKVYYDGLLNATASAGPGDLDTNSYNVTIGGEVNLGTALDFKGSMDDVRLYGRALSAEQIAAIYENRSDLILSQELASKDGWSVCVTPNDGTSDGATNCSSTLKVDQTGLPSITSVTLNTSDGWNTSRSDLTAWPQGASDPDGDTIHHNYDWRRNGTSIALVNLDFDQKDWTGAATTVTDRSSHSNDGTLGSGSAKPTWGLTSGWNGTGAYTFDGGDYISLGDLADVDNSNTVLSIAAWVKPDSGPSDDMCIVCKYDASAGQREFRLRVQSDLQVEWGVQETSGSYDPGTEIVSSATLSAETWHHVAATFEGGESMRLYIDGVAVGHLVGSDVPADFDDDAEPLLIGALRGGADDHFQGEIDSVLILNRSLSPQEVALLAQNQSHTLADQETFRGENWTVCATPNDGADDGSETCSQGLTFNDPPRFVSERDFDDDGLPDLLFGSHNNSEPSGEQPRIYFGNGSMPGQYYREDEAEAALGHTYNSIIADLNNDGWLDWIRSTALTNYSRIQWGAQGGFSSYTDLPAVISTGSCVADYNRDGWLDILFLEYNSSNGGNVNSRLYWNEQGSFSSSNYTNISTKSPHGCVAGDFDRDGWSDIFISFNHEGTDEADTNISSRIYWNEQGDFSSSNYSSIQTISASMPNAADLNRDGYLEIIPGSSGLTKIFWGDEGATYTNVTTLETGKKSAAIADLNRDGWPELIFVTNATGSYYVNNTIYWNEQGSFDTGNTTELPAVGPVKIVPWDMDMDGWPDLVFTNEYNGSTNDVESSIYWNDGGSFSAASHTNYSTYKAWAAEVAPGTVTPNATKYDGRQAQTLHLPDLYLRTNTSLENALDLDMYFHDYDGDALTYDAVGNTSDVTISIGADGRVNLTPTAGWTGSVSGVRFTASDGTYTATSNNFTIWVADAPAPPIVSSVTITETGPGPGNAEKNLTATVSASDPNGDDIRYAWDWRVENTSIAVLNMNFDVENSAGVGKTKDYSTFGNNGTLGASTASGSDDPIWSATGGWNGTGAFEFDGVSDYINASNSSTLHPGTGLTVAAWFRPASIGLVFPLGKYDGGSNQRSWFLGMNASGAIWARVSIDGTGTPGTTMFDAIGGTFSVNTWQHVALTVDATTGNMTVYLNGEVTNSTIYPALNAIHGGTTPVSIGSLLPSTGPTYFYNGTIDSVLIYNRSLSAAQVLALYNNRSDLIVSNETTVGENWSVCVTPNDARSDGSEACSNTLTIRNSSCTYPGSGDWNVLCDDACTLSSSTDLLGNDVIFSGSGVTTVTGTVYNFTDARTSGDCSVTVTGGGSLG